MGALLRSLALVSGGALLKRALVALAFHAAAGLFVLLALVFGLVAGYAALVPGFGPVYAALIVAAGLLGVALLIRLALAIVQYRQRRRARALGALATPLAAAAAPAVAANMTKLPVVIAVGVLAAGYILARRA